LIAATIFDSIYLFQVALTESAKNLTNFGIILAKPEKAKSTKACPVPFVLMDNGKLAFI
jgi:hypothetical protein